MTLRNTYLEGGFRGEVQKYTLAKLRRGYFQKKPLAIFKRKRLFSNEMAIFDRRQLFHAKPVGGHSWNCGWNCGLDLSQARGRPIWAAQALRTPSHWRL
jgi:hypothetical protein